MGLKRHLAIAVLFMGWLASPAAASDQCDLIPESVSQSTVYSGYSEGLMCKAGLTPLWQGLPKGVARAMRFTFSSGHSMFFRTVTITEFADGTGRIEVVGGGFVKRDVRTPWRDIKRQRRKLSPADLASIRKLIEQSGAFEHEIGTWDKMADDRTIFLHCQLLEMEQMDVQGYRFSSVNIGCNRPSKLMPLVDDVIARGKIEMVRSNWAGHP